MQTNSKVKVETKPKSRLVRHLDSDDEIRENDTNAVSSVSLSTTYPKDIRCFNSRQIWTCKNEHNMMDCIIPVQDQELIATLTGATLVQDLNHQRIFVGALSEESLHRAIHKLNNVRKYFVSLICILLCLFDVNSSCEFFRYATSFILRTLKTSRLH